MSDEGSEALPIEFKTPSLISAIIPTFNRAGMLERAIESVFDQSHRPLELIVVNDGSTDNTQEILATYSAKAKASGLAFRSFEKENGGCASARNLGLRQAEGNHIAFLDSDDAWLPDAMSSLLEVLQTSGADFVYSPSIEVFPKGPEKICLPCAAGKPEDFAIEHFKTTRVRPGSLLYRKEVFSRVEGFDEGLRFNEDSDFLQRVAILFEAAYSPEPTLRFHHHAGNKSKQRPAIYRALLQSNQNILKEHPAFAEKLGKLAFDRKREIEDHLIEALILSDKLDEAREAARELKGRRLKPGVRWALSTGSKRLYETFSWLP